MISDDGNHKSSNNIIILQQIEDCRDRNDTVLQFTVDPITFGYNTPANSSATPQYSVNDLKSVLDEELVKNFSLTSSSNELIFSAVNCSLLLCMKVLTALRKKSWIILTSNAYLDIYTNCIVKTFYFEKYSQSKLFAVTSPTAANLPNGSSVPAFAPRSNILKRSSTSNAKNPDDPLLNASSSETDLSGSSYPRGSPTGRSQTPQSYSNNGHQDVAADPPSISQPVASTQPTTTAPVRRESLRRQPPPPPSASTIRSNLSIGTQDTLSASDSASKLTSPIMSPQSNYTRNHNSSTNSMENDDFSSNEPASTNTSNNGKKITAARGSVNQGYLANVPGANQSSPRPETKIITNKPTTKAGFVPSSAPSPTMLASAEAVTSPTPVPLTSPSSVTVNDQVNANHSTYSTPSSTPHKPQLDINTNMSFTDEPITTPNGGDMADVPVVEAAPPSFGSSMPSSKEEKFSFGSPLSMMAGSRTQSMPASVLASGGESTSPTGANAKNSEYFKKLKEAQDLEKQKQLEEESKMSSYELQKKREAEAEVLQHESSKTAHYARLGATFVNRGSPLVAGAAGRGPVPTGRLGGRGNR